MRQQLIDQHPAIYQHFGAKVRLYMVDKLEVEMEDDHIKIYLTRVICKSKRAIIHLQIIEVLEKSINKIHSFIDLNHQWIIEVIKNNLHSLT